jgi:ABC-2 type transport system permease protein
LELIYWPAVQLFVWGLLQIFIMQHSGFFARAAGLFIGAVLMWDILFRGQLGFSVSFLEEMWSRNLGQLFASPLRPYEWGLSLLAISLLRTLIGTVPASVLAIPLYHYSVFEMGLPLIAFFFNLLVFGAAVGLAVCSLVLRYGLGAESLAWIAIFLVAPICGIYYPVATLPEWLQSVAFALPATYVFEGMRALVVDHVFRLDYMGFAVGLNVVFLLIGFGVFLYAFRVARRIGLLMQVGE